MREIKFRVWDKIQKQMHYPEKAKYCLTMVGSVCDDFTDDGGGSLCVSYRCVAMLSTGLKDKNGVEIYEGDIIQYEYEGEHRRDIVEYGIWSCSHCDGVYGWGLREQDGEGLRGAIIIIGNIYENPDLLKNKK